MPTIYYKAGYDYVLSRDIWFETPILPDQDIVRDLFTLFKDGRLFVKKHFAWDGASGAPDFKETLPATIPHDIFCQLMNEGILDYEKYSPLVHEFFGTMCKEDGFWFSGLWRAAVILGRGGHPSHDRSNPELTAP
jgi:hypothetical protein